MRFHKHFWPHCKAVGRSENQGVPVVMWGHNLPPLVEIGLTDVPKFGHPRDNRPELYNCYLQKNMLKHVNGETMK